MDVEEILGYLVQIYVWFDHCRF